MNFFQPLALVCAVGGLFFVSAAQADDKKVVPPNHYEETVSTVHAEPAPFETKKDLPGDRTRYFGERRDLVGTPRKIAKIDLDADFGGDGVIDNWDPTDNGAVQQTPPGLVVGRGDLQKLVLRVWPYRADYRGEAVIRLEVGGINRNSKSGEFASVEEEIANSGGIRVYADQGRTELLLDSADPNKRLVEWTLQPGRQTGVPGTLYAEGVKPSKFSGDVRLLFYAESRNKVIKTFGPSYDHIVLTVEPGSLPRRDNGTTYWAADRHAAVK